MRKFICENGNEYVMHRHGLPVACCMQGLAALLSYAARQPAGTHDTRQGHQGNRMTILTQNNLPPAPTASPHRLSGLAWLWPQDCFLCAAPAAAALLCPVCAKDLPRLGGPACPVCALPTVDAAVCGRCLKQTPYFDATHAAFRYAFPVDRLIQALKYRHNLALARFLSAALRQTAQTSDAHADLLMALPLADQRLAERGFNQAMELARPLAGQLNIPLPMGGYTRAINTPPQASLPWKERQKNIRGAFECALDLRDKHIIVIDDVMTTGASLNEFARTLKKHGARRVTNWVVARAVRDA